MFHFFLALQRSAKTLKPIVFKALTGWIAERHSSIQ
jgi:hypothetical protein